MNLNTHNSKSSFDSSSDAASAEATLRLVAQLSAPAGLEDRVMTGLHLLPRRGRLLQWPAMLQPGSSWMRGAAAAAIVFVVAGGGWGIYSRVQSDQPAKVIVMPRAGAGGGFSSAGAMRTPQTLNGPIVAEPVTGHSGNAKQDEVQPVLVKPLKKAPAKVVPMTPNSTKAGVPVKLAADSARSSVQ